MADPNAFTGAALDRGSDRERQDARWLREQYADPRARALVAGSAGIQMADGRLALTALRDLSDFERALLLGRDGQGPVFAYDEEPPPEEPAVPPLVGAGGRRGEPPAPRAGPRVGPQGGAPAPAPARGGPAAPRPAPPDPYRPPPRL